MLGSRYEDPTRRDIRETSSTGSGYKANDPYPPAPEHEAFRQKSEGKDGELIGANFLSVLSKLGSNSFISIDKVQ